MVCRTTQGAKHNQLRFQYAFHHVLRARKPGVLLSILIVVTLPAQSHKLPSSAEAWPKEINPSVEMETMRTNYIFVAFSFQNRGELGVLLASESLAHCNTVKIYYHQEKKKTKNERKNCRINSGIVKEVMDLDCRNYKKSTAVV